MKKKKKEAVFSDDDKKEIRHQTAQFIAACGLPLSTFEKPAAKEYIEFIMEKTGKSKDAAATFCPSRQLICNSLSATAAEVKESIQKNGNLLAQQGGLTLQLDHWCSNKLSSHEERDYLGVILSVRDENGILTSTSLAFQPTLKKTHAVVTEQLCRILKVILKIRMSFYL